MTMQPGVIEILLPHSITRHGSTRPATAGFAATAVSRRPPMLAISLSGEN